MVMYAGLLLALAFAIYSAIHLRGEKKQLRWLVAVPVAVGLGSGLQVCVRTPTYPPARTPTRANAYTPPGPTAPDSSWRDGHCCKEDSRGRWCSDSCS